VNQAAGACPGPRTASLVGGEYVVATVLARAIAKTGRTMENEQCFLFKIRDDRIVHGRVYADTAKARELVSASPARREQRLERAGLLRRQRRGPRPRVPFQPAAARERGEFIERQRKSWEEKLDQFARYVEDGDA